MKNKRFFRILPYIILFIISVFLASSVTAILDNLFHLNSDDKLWFFHGIFWPIIIIGALYLSNPNRKPFYFDSRLNQLHECTVAIFDDINKKTHYQYSYELRHYKKHILKYINENRSVLKNSTLSYLDQTKLLINEQSELYSKTTYTYCIFCQIKPYCEIETTARKADIDYDIVRQEIFNKPDYTD